MTEIQVRMMRAGASGKDAWEPVIGIAQDGSRLVMQIVNWVGGEGPKPVTGIYIGPDGYVDEIAKAVDVKGVGQKGWSPVLSAEQDGARSVLKVADWTGGEGVKPDAGLYIAFSGLTPDVAAAIDIRGATGPQGPLGPIGPQGGGGPVGPQGPIPAHQWSGTSLAFQKPDGTYETPVNLQGSQGNQGPKGETGDASAPDSVTNAQLANMPAGTLKGAVIAGDPQDLTVGQVFQILGFSLTDLAPTGAIMDWAFTSAPTGWLIMTGQLLNRNAYPKLWAAAQAGARLVTDAQWGAGDWGTFSTGDGATTFRLPDPRGEFIRALDSGRGADGGRLLGSSQGEAFKAHTHTGQTDVQGEHAHATATNVVRNIYPTPTQWGVTAGGNMDVNNVATTNSTGAHAHNLTVNSAGGAETRPRNIAWNKIIKF